MDTTELLDAAKKASLNSYSPYSKIRVGAAVFGCGRIFTGVNVENASYGLTMCAERVAIFKAVSEGCREIEGVAIYSPDVFPIPCGACLQVMAEFCSGDCRIIISSEDRVEETTLDALLPRRFSLKDY